MMPGARMMDMPMTNSGTHLCQHVCRWTRIGTVIHGTMLNEDLIPAFFSELEEIDPVLANDLHRRFDADLSANDVDASLECLCELMDGIQACCPTGIYFGANEGDGSDYGYWFMEPDDVRMVDELPSKPGKDECEIITVNDHGNVPLYAWFEVHKDWVEVYGIV